MACIIKIIDVSPCPCCGAVIKAEVIPGQFEPLHVACVNPCCDGKLTVTANLETMTYDFKQELRIHGC